MTFSKIYSLSFDFYEDSYEKNLAKFTNLIKQCQANSLILAPELCLTNFSFENMQKASEFGKVAISEITKLSHDKTICWTLTTKKNNNFYNTAIMIKDEKIIYQRDKYKLFKFGDEDKYFHEGNEKDIKIVLVNGIKIAILICFEIRFIELWQKIRGADVVLVPALWGKLRKQHLEQISEALAVLNQCYVIVANSKNDNMAGSSAIITPFGEVVRDDTKEILSLDFDKKLIKKMRRYMDVGIG